MKLHEFRYSPGYSDMRGARHEERLAKNENGVWTVVCSDREHFDAPTVVTVYEVSSEAEAAFEAFLETGKVSALADRRRSDVFCTDYSPWEFTIDYEDSSDKRKPAYFRIEEYKKYSKKDYALIAALRDRFRALRGKKISDFEERND